MDREGFDHRHFAMFQRIRALYQSAGPEQERQNLLSRVFDELENALELLLTMEKQVLAGHEEMLAWIDSVERERARYQELFDLVPLAYLVTSLDGTIRQANHAASALLGREAHHLVGRSLTLFVPEGERRPFHSIVAELPTTSRREWEFRLQPWNDTPLVVAATVAPTRDRAGRSTALLWLLRNASERKRVEKQLGSAIVEQERQIGELTAAPATAPNRGAPPTPEERAETLRQKFAFLAEVSVLLAVALDDEAALVRVAYLAVPVIADLCILDVIAGDGMLNRLVVAYKDAAREVPARKLQDCPPYTLVAQELQSGQPTLCTHIPGAGRLEEAAVSEGVLLVPLHVQGQLLGVITLVLLEEGRSFGPDDLALAEELARRAAIALNRGRLYRET